MQNTITLDSKSANEQIDNDKSAASLSSKDKQALKPLVIYAIFVATCATLAYGGLLSYAIVFFLIGSLCLGASYIWSHINELDIDLSFTIDLEQEELERDLYQEAA